jgi:hypothetical protein
MLTKKVMQRSSQQVRNCRTKVRTSLRESLREKAESLWGKCEKPTKNEKSEKATAQGKCVGELSDMSPWKSEGFLA